MQVNNFEDEPDVWVEIHDSLYGFGVRRRDKVLYAKDVAYFLKKDLFEPGLDFDIIYEEIQPLIQAAREKRRKYYEEHPIKYDRIILPKVNKSYPTL